MSRKRRNKKTVHPLTHARELAMQGLYQVELSAQSTDQVMRFGWLNEAIDSQKQTFARHLIEEVIENKGTLDLAIHVHSHKHRTQISNIVRCLLRMALFELQAGTTPVAVILNEYLELTRKYDGEESVPYLNGVLDSYNKEISQVSSDDVENTTEIAQVAEDATGLPQA